MSLIRIIPIACCLGLFGVDAHAEERGPTTDAPELQEVTVTATKSPIPLIEAPATVSVLTSNAIERQVAADIKDLVRYEPGVSVRNARTRFGLTDFNIRGIEGNRVLLEVDNVRLPDAFSFGSFGTATRDGIELDLLKRVEIVRGSVSSLYGSEAIGGVVAFTTKDPSDLLGDSNAFGGSVKLGYSDEDEGSSGTALLAARSGAWSGLFAYTRRESGTYSNQGTNNAFNSTRTLPNPQDGYGDSFLGKAVWQPREGHAFKLTLERSRTDVFSDVLSGRSASPTLQVTSQLGNDEQQRGRIALEHVFTDLAWTLADSGEWRIYSQDSETTNYTSEERVVVSGPTTTSRVRERIFRFAEDTVGGELTLRKTFEGERIDQTITYGVEFYRNDIEQSRDGYELNRTTGIRSNVVGADVFPVRDTPLATAKQTSAYVQDEIKIGALTLTPSLRVDRYELEPELDAIFAADNPGITPTPLTDTSVSPRLGAVWRVADNTALFASYSRGFRSPPFGDVNVGFTNSIGRYTTIPNPDLKPETSNNFEVGMRYAAGPMYWSTSIYFNAYKDFIESFSLIGTQPVTGFLVFQSRNLGEVETYGIEFKGGFDVTDRLPGLRLKSAVSYGVGDNTVTDAPLNTIDPLRGVVGLEYRPAGRRWGGELIATLVDRKNKIAQPTAPASRLFASPGYTTFDLIGDLRLLDGLNLNVGIFNLTDKRYWEWADVRGRSANDPALDFYTSPGRTVSANLKYSF